MKTSYFFHYYILICFCIVGVVLVFDGLILGLAKNPSLIGQLFSYTILILAFAEATGLFALMMVFLLLYVV